MFRGDIYHAEEVPAFTPHDLHAVWVESPYSAWAVGEASTILHWNGERWWPQATATNVGPLNAVRAHPDDGLWIGGAGRIINRHPTYGSSLYDSDAEVRAIWGRHPDDLWMLCTDRLAMWWNGEKCERIVLPGDDDEQWNAVAGNAAGETFIVGLSGFMMQWDGRRWYEIATDTDAILTGAVCVGPSLFVTTDDGLVREYRRGQWRTVGTRFTIKTLKNVAYERMPTASMAIRLARFAGVPIDDVIAGKYPPAGACPYCGRGPSESQSGTASSHG